MNILTQLRKCVNHPYLFDGKFVVGCIPEYSNQVSLLSVPGVQIVERERKIHKEKKIEGRLEGERGRKRCSLALATPPPVPPRFPGVQLNSLPHLPPCSTT